MLTYKNSSSHLRIRQGIYHFVRRVPTDLQQYYRSDRVSISLKTRSHNNAMRTASSINQKLDDYWLGLRLKEMDVPALHLLVEDGKENEHSSPTILEAADIYLRIKRNSNPTFVRAVKRNTKYLVKALGNKPITAYSSADAASFRDKLFKKSLSIGSVKRILGSLRSIINLVIREMGIEGSNAFANVYLHHVEHEENKRLPIMDTSLFTLQDACVEKNDQLRWLVALLSDTGMRLAEAVGLHLDDIQLDTDIPHLVIQPYPWRRLKTKSSKRTVPLVGVSLLAAQQVVKHHTEFAFPKYCDGTNTNSNSASAALNKWIKTVIGKEYVIHGLRHGLRDRLRAVECPSDIIDAIGGWTTEGVGQTYGKGYTLEILSRWLDRITPKELCTPPR